MNALILEDTITELARDSSGTMSCNPNLAFHSCVNPLNQTQLSVMTLPYITGI